MSLTRLDELTIKRREIMMYGGQTEVSCSQSVERELENIDRQLTEYVAFSEAISRFMNSGIRYSVLDNREENNFMFALYGSMVLQIPKMNAERARLIERLDEEEVERAKLAEALLLKRKYATKDILEG
jgi:hypothetical protein